MAKSKLKKLKDKCWKLCSQYTRLKYAKNDKVQCYTCGIVKPVKKMQAGHGISGRTNSILFEDKVLRPQCYGCNVGRGGNYEVFVLKLIQEYGEEGYKKLLAQKFQAKKFTIMELEELIEEYTGKIEIIQEARK